MTDGDDPLPLLCTYQVIIMATSRFAGTSQTPINLLLHESKSVCVCVRVSQRLCLFPENKTEEKQSDADPPLNLSDYCDLIRAPPAE